MAKEVKRRYTAEERKAYYMGWGAAIGMGRYPHIKKRADRMSSTCRESFFNGFNDFLARGALNKTRKK